MKQSGWWQWMAALVMPAGFGACLQIDAVEEDDYLAAAYESDMDGGTMPPPPTSPPPTAPMPDAGAPDAGVMPPPDGGAGGGGGGGGGGAGQCPDYTVNWIRNNIANVTFDYACFAIASDVMGGAGALCDFMAGGALQNVPAGTQNCENFITNCLQAAANQNVCIPAQYFAWACVRPPGADNPFDNVSTDDNGDGTVTISEYCTPELGLDAGSI